MRDLALLTTASQARQRSTASPLVCRSFAIPVPICVNLRTSAVKVFSSRAFALPFFALFLTYEALWRNGLCPGAAIEVFPTVGLASEAALHDKSICVDLRFVRLRVRS